MFGWIRWKRLQSACPRRMEPKTQAWISVSDSSAWLFRMIWAEQYEIRFSRCHLEKQWWLKTTHPNWAIFILLCWPPITCGIVLVNLEVSIFWKRMISKRKNINSQHHCSLNLSIWNEKLRCFLKILFIYFNWKIVYSIVTAFAIHQHESAIGIHMPPPPPCQPELPSYHPSHPILPRCHRAPALGALLHASNSHWSFVLHMVMHMYPCSSHKSSHPLFLPLSPELCSFLPGSSLLLCM